MVLGRLLRVGEAKTLKRLRVIADHVNAIEDEYVAMSDDELRGQTAAFKERLEKGETTDDLLIEAFAVVRVKDHPAEPITVDAALLQMELVGHDFYLFNDAEAGVASVVYRRRGFDYGLLRLK